MPDVTMSPKPWIDTIVKRLLPSATRKWVRNPASLALYSLSKPMHPPQTMAASRRKSSSVSILYVSIGVIFCESWRQYMAFVL